MRKTAHFDATEGYSMPGGHCHEEGPVHPSILKKIRCEAGAADFPASMRSAVLKQAASLQASGKPPAP